MTYVPEGQRTTAWYLFHKLYRVRVNPNKIRTVDEIKLYGTPTTGNTEYDRELAKNEEVVMISIAQMEDIFNQGYPVKIVRFEDTKEIYEHIARHLVAMRNIMHGSENFTNNPDTMNELIRLDQFAAAMFTHARYHMKEDVPQSGLVARMRGERFSRLGRKGRTPVAETPSTGSGSLRDYATGTDVKTPLPMHDDPRAVDEVVEDPNLPRRVSLERLFENQKRMGMNWGGE